MNGFAMYTTWTVVASLINLTTSLTYTGGTDMKASRPFVQCSPARPDPELFFAGSGSFLPDPDPFFRVLFFCRFQTFLPDRTFSAESGSFLPNPSLFCWIHTLLTGSVPILPNPVCRIRNFMLIQKFFVKSGDKRHIFFCDIKIIFKPA